MEVGVEGLVLAVAEPMELVCSRSQGGPPIP